MPAPRFVLDEDVPHHLAGLLRSRGHDADSAKELGRLGLSDVQAFLRAVDDRRAFVTHNGKDFRALHEAWVTWRRRWVNEVARDWNVAVHLSQHAGILVVPQLTTHRLADLLEAFLASTGSIEDRLFAWSDPKGWHEPGF